MRYELIGVFSIETALPMVRATAEWCALHLNDIDVNCVRFTPEHRESLGIMEFQHALPDDQLSAIRFEMFPQLVSVMRSKYGSSLKALEIIPCR